MNTLRGTTRVPAVAVLLASLLLAACGPGPAPAEEASAPLAVAADTLGSGSTAPAASAIPGRDVPVPTRVARASDVAPGGVCPSTADEPATIDGGREVTQVPESDVPVQDTAPVPPEASRP